jgi:hypothetical protein
MLKIFSIMKLLKHIKEDTRQVRIKKGLRRSIKEALQEIRSSGNWQE